MIGKNSLGGSCTLRVICINSLLSVLISLSANAATNNVPNWIDRPLSLADALNIALQQNGTILKARNDLEGNAGLVAQTRAIVYPKATIAGQYQRIEESSIDSPAGATFLFGT